MSQQIKLIDKSFINIKILMEIPGEKKTHLLFCIKDELNAFFF